MKLLASSSGPATQCKACLCDLAHQLIFGQQSRQLLHILVAKVCRGQETGGRSRQGMLCMGLQQTVDSASAAAAHMSSAGRHGQGAVARQGWLPSRFGQAGCNGCRCTRLETGTAPLSCHSRATYGTGGPMGPGTQAGAHPAPAAARPAPPLPPRLGAAAHPA